MLQFKKYDEANDGRRKILTSQHEEIIAKHKEGTSQRQLGIEYGVSRSIIKFIVSPEALERHKNSKKGTWKKRYNKEEHRKNIAKYRMKKKLLGFQLYKKA